jgi:hypothetical protein
MLQAKTFSSFQTRIALNNAFKAKGIQKPVISIAILSIKGNIIITITPEFNSDFLIQHKDIIKGVHPSLIDL